MKGLLLFDWTGTLVDEYELDEAVCANMESEIAKKLKITMEEARRMYETLLNKYKESWEWYNYLLHAKVFGISWKDAQLWALPKIKLIPGSIEVLSHYRKEGYEIYLLTNAVKKVIELRLRYLRMKKFFNSIITSDMVNSSKSSGKHLELALKSTSIPRKKCYMIGDSPSQDILPAKQFGINTVQCKFGSTAYFHSRELNDTLEKSAHIAEPDYFISKIRDLFSIIK